MDKIDTSRPFVTELLKVEQTNGSVLHAIKASNKGFCGFGEAYFSTVKFKKTKGWKLHKRMTLNLVVPHGEIRLIVHDGNKLAGQKQVDPIFDITLGDNNYSRLTVPPGYWVAFQGVGQGSNLLLNIADIEHDPKEAINKDLRFFEVTGLDYFG